MQKRKASKPVKVVIPRNKWLRGQGTGTLLVNKEFQETCPSARLGQQCCLGFYCEVRGVPRRKMGNQGVPGDIVNEKWACRDWLDEAARINDSTMYCNEEREKILRSLAGKHRVKFEFVDSVRKATTKTSKSKKTSKSTGKGTRTRKSSY